jgi:hypothetical protein
MARWRSRVPGPPPPCLPMWWLLGQPFSTPVPVPRSGPTAQGRSPPVPERRSRQSGLSEPSMKADDGQTGVAQAAATAAQHLAVHRIEGPFPQLKAARHRGRCANPYHLTPKPSQIESGPPYADKLSAQICVSYSSGGPGRAFHTYKIRSSMNRCKVRLNKGSTSGCWSSMGCIRLIQSAVSERYFGNAASLAGVPGSPVFRHVFDVRSSSAIRGEIAVQSARSADVVSPVVVAVAAADFDVDAGASFGPDRTRARTPSTRAAVAIISASSAAHDNRRRPGEGCCGAGGHGCATPGCPPYRGSISPA